LRTACWSKSWISFEICSGDSGIGSSHYGIMAPRLATVYH